MPESQVTLDGGSKAIGPERINSCHPLALINPSYQCTVLVSNCFGAAIRDHLAGITFDSGFQAKHAGSESYQAHIVRVLL